MPGDCPKPGGPLPNGTPPGACTALCLHAVEGGSSSMLSGLVELAIEELRRSLAHPSAQHLAMD